MRDHPEERVPAQESTHGASPERAADFRQSFEARLRTEGLASALAMLNQRTRFRFTGLYRVVPPDLHNVSLYDRENPTLSISGAVCPLTQTYCSIVRDRGLPFHVSDAPAERTLQAHPAKESVQSYAGVPVRLPGGQVLGTLCHFDGRPRLMPPSELSMLQAVAPLLAPWLTDDRSPLS
jgi:GAF domain-containing protein